MDLNSSSLLFNLPPSRSDNEQRRNTIVDIDPKLLKKLP